MAGPETCKGKTGEVVMGKLGSVEMGRVELDA
jgi:hypothetical protein